MPEIKKGRAALIAKFFGRKDGQTSTDLIAEIKDLSDSDRTELAQRIAKQQNLTQDQVDFQLA